MDVVPVTAGTTVGQFVKIVGAAETGGHAKTLVQQGAVRVNGSVEVRRGHRLDDGDAVEVQGRAYTVRLQPR